MLLSLTGKTCTIKSWACRAPETGAAGAVDGFRITRKAAEGASPWQLRRHRPSQASTPWAPGPCLQHSHSCGAAVHLLAWSNEHLWRFCSVCCCCSARSIQKLPKNYVSTSLVPAVRASTTKTPQGKSPEWNPHRLVGWWIPREKWMPDIGSFQWKLPVQKRSTASLAPPAPHSERSLSARDGRWIFQKWHPAMMEGEPPNIWKNSIIQNSPSCFIKPLWTQENSFWCSLHATIDPKPNWTLELR